MNVTLTPELEALVKRKVESGSYESSVEVIREALRLLEERDKLMALRRDIQEGIDSGKSTPLDMEEIITEAQEEFSRQSGAGND